MIISLPKEKNRKNRKHKTSNDEADCILLNPKSKPRKNSNLKEGDTECRYCGTIVERILIKDHLNVDCMNQRLPCEFCDIPIHRTSYIDHAKECNQNPYRKRKPNKNKIKAHEESLPCDNCGEIVRMSDYMRHNTRCNGTSRKEVKKYMGGTSKLDKNRGKQNEEVVHVECNICGTMINAKHLFRHEKNHAKGINDLDFGVSSNDLSLMNNPGNEEIIVERNAVIRVRRNVIPGVENSLMFVVEHLNRNQPGISQLPNIIFNSNKQEHGLDSKTMKSFVTSKFDNTRSTNFDDECKKCIICLNDFEHGDELKFLPCTHRFHALCIDPWLNDHPTCPNCKRNFRPNAN